MREYSEYDEECTCDVGVFATCPACERIKSYNISYDLRKNKDSSRDAFFDFTMYEVGERLLSGKMTQQNIDEINNCLEMVFTFGKHSGKTVHYVLLNEPHYIKWLHQQKITRIKISSLITAMACEMMVIKCDNYYCHQDDTN